MTKMNNLVRAIMRSVSIQLEEYYAKHKKEIEEFTPLINRHADLIRARRGATTGTQVAAFEREIELTEQSMRNHLLTIAIKLNQLNWKDAER